MTSCSTLEAYQPREITMPKVKLVVIKLPHLNIITKAQILKSVDGDSTSRSDDFLWDLGATSLRIMEETL